MRATEGLQRSMRGEVHGLGAGLKGAHHRSQLGRQAGQIGEQVRTPDSKGRKLRANCLLGLLWDHKLNQPLGALWFSSLQRRVVGMKCESAHLGLHAWIDFLTVDCHSRNNFRQPSTREGASRDLPDPWVSDLNQAVRRIEKAVRPQCPDAAVIVRMLQHSEVRRNERISRSNPASGLGDHSVELERASRKNHWRQGMVYATAMARGTQNDRSGQSRHRTDLGAQGCSETPAAPTATQRSRARATMLCRF